jgi:hypothetical protein
MHALHVPEEHVAMPRICAFDGIILLMFYDDHSPPHFHARYGEHQALVHIAPPSIAEGRLPQRVERQVLAWTERRQAELLANWQRARAELPLQWIDP